MERFTQQWRRASMGICIDSSSVRMAEWRIRVEEDVAQEQVRLQDGDARAEATNPETPAARQPMQDMPDYIELERAWAGTPEQADTAATKEEEATPRMQA